MLAAVIESLADFMVAIMMLVGTDERALFAAVTFAGDGDAGGLAGVKAHGELADYGIGGVNVVELHGEDAMTPCLDGAAAFQSTARPRRPGGA